MKKLTVALIAPSDQLRRHTETKWEVELGTTLRELLEYIEQRVSPGDRVVLSRRSLGRLNDRYERLAGEFLRDGDTVMLIPEEVYA